MCHLRVGDVEIARLGLKEQSINWFKKVINENLIKADILSRALLESWDGLNYQLSSELIMRNWEVLGANGWD